MKTNPIIYSDFPDLDVIRVEDTYYMISTTMHMFPGGVILRSYDLLNWEILTYIFNQLEGTPAQKLEQGSNIYGQGMWAASLRYHKGRYYVCFSANDTQKTYLYQSDNIMGPWKLSNIEGFYHDCSLLFDEDRIFIMYGNTNIYVTELNSDLSRPMPGGLNRIVITDENNVSLGYEGSHIQKINGKYYVFLIHWLAAQSQRRTQACFVSDSLDGEFTGKDVLDDDMEFHNAGVAQGGIIDTPEGEWYAVLFQDCGAIGRCPYVVPVSWENDFPVFGKDGKIPREIAIKSSKEAYHYKPLVDSDDFKYQPSESGVVELKKVWQWNHTPDHSLWSVTENPGNLRIYTNRLSANLVRAKNIVTQRMMGPITSVVVTVDGKQLNEGDYAGICALQGCYGFLAVTKSNGRYDIVMMGKEYDTKEGIWGVVGGDKNPGKEYERIHLNDSKIKLKIMANFSDSTDEACFYYFAEGRWNQLGPTHKLHYLLDHFMGCRAGLFIFSTKETGGFVDFSDFIYEYY